MADDDDEITSIQITKGTWRELNGRKQGPNDTFDDVVTRLLNDG